MLRVGMREARGRRPRGTSVSLQCCGDEDTSGVVFGVVTLAVIVVVFIVSVLYGCVDVLRERGVTQ